VHQLDSLSDVHVHLGSGMRVEYRVHELLIAPTNADTTQLPIDLQIRLNDESLNTQELLFTISALEQAIIDAQLSRDDKYVKSSEREPCRDERYDELYRILQLIQNESFFILHDKCDAFTQIRQDENIYFGKECKLLRQAHSHFINGEIIYADRYLMLYFIKLLHETKNRYLKCAIKIYLIMRNMLKSALVQQHRRAGLGYFSTYSRSRLRRSLIQKEKKDIIKSFDNLATQLDMPINIEARLSPKDSIQKLRADLKEYVDEYERLESDKLHLKFIYHFIKEKHARKDDIRFGRLKKKLKKESIALVNFLAQKHLCFDMSKYFAGIDAASKEYHTPPYVFAPIYRYFKTSKRIADFYRKYEMPCLEEREEEETKCEPFDVKKFMRGDYEKSTVFKRQINTKYTYHVGEDFRDLVSGIRSIFEAILFLNLKDGDRIGHAIALGMDATLYYERVGYIQLTNEELFDNMVFLYYMLDLYNNDALRECKFYAKQVILELGHYIYQGVEEINRCCVDDFIDAWFLRRNCYIELKLMQDRFNIEDSDVMQCIDKYKECMIIPDIDYTLAALPDFFHEEIDELNIFEKRYDTARYNQEAMKIYLAYMRNDTFGIGNQQSVLELGQEVYRKRIKHFIDAIGYIQGILKKELVVQRGVAIEVMPTSNLLISHIHSHNEHPMYQFKSLEGRDDDIEIYISSDNPMLQNTNIAKEYDYVYNHLKIKHGERKAMEYVGRIAKSADREFKR
jgi:adenosine deaminase